MRGTECADRGLFAQIREAFLQVGVNGQRKSSFRYLRHSSGFQSLRSSFGRGGEFARIFGEVIAGRNVPSTKFVQAPRGDEVCQAIDAKYSGDACAIVDETDQRAGEEHSGLHANQYGSVGAGKLALGHHFLDQRVDVSPIHGGAGAGDERDEIEMPQFEMSAPGDVGGGKNGNSPREIEDDAEVAAVVAVNEYAADKGNQQPRSGRNDHLVADLDGGMRKSEDVPADAGEVHSAAKKGNEHREEKITEPGCCPDQRPVSANGGCGGRRGHRDVIVYSF